MLRKFFIAALSTTLMTVTWGLHLWALMLNQYPEGPWPRALITTAGLVLIAIAGCAWADVQDTVRRKYDFIPDYVEGDLEEAWVSGMEAYQVGDNENGDMWRRRYNRLAQRHGVKVW